MAGECRLATGRPRANAIAQRHCQRRRDGQQQHRSRRRAQHFEKQKTGQCRAQRRAEDVREIHVRDAPPGTVVGRHGVVREQRQKPLHTAPPKHQQPPWARPTKRIDSQAPQGDCENSRRRPRRVPRAPLLGRSCLTPSDGAPRRRGARGRHRPPCRQDRCRETGRIPRSCRRSRRNRRGTRVFPRTATRTLPWRNKGPQSRWGAISGSKPVRVRALACASAGRLRELLALARDWWLRAIAFRRWNRERRRADTASAITAKLSAAATTTLDWSPM